MHENRIHENCLNCGAPLLGKYCATCGQKDQPTPPDFHHFLHEVAHEFLHVDGKILHSLKLLLWAPGKLTTEYWSGRRTIQVPPLRLYLLASVFMFGLVLLLPNVTRVPFEPQMTVTVDDFDNGKPHSVFDLPVEKRKQVIETLVRPDTPLGHFFKEPLLKMVEDPQEFRHRLLGNASKTMFLMLPLFALVTFVLFRVAHRVYLEQLVLALHLHSIIFLLFALSALISAEGQTAFRFVGDSMLLIGIPLYSLKTFRNVFGLSWISTLIRSLLTAAVYLPIFIVIEIGLVIGTLSTL